MVLTRAWCSLPRGSEKDCLSDGPGGGKYMPVSALCGGAPRQGWVQCGADKQLGTGGMQKVETLVAGFSA